MELRVLDENAPHDASCVIQIIAEALERVNGLCSKRNQSFPSKLLVIGDNTVRELKKFPLPSIFGQLDRSTQNAFMCDDDVA